MSGGERVDDMSRQITVAVIEMWRRHLVQADRRPVGRLV